MHSRIALANVSFQRLLPVWKSNVYSLKLKLRLFQSIVLSVPSHAIKCLKLIAEQEKRLTAFENNCLRRIFKITCWDRVSNDENHKSTGQLDIATVARQRRWHYLGHIIRMPDHRLPKILLHWQPEGTRRQGRPKTRSVGRLNVTEEPSSVFIPERENIYVAAPRREDRRLLTDALCATGVTGGTKV